MWISTCVRPIWEIKLKAQASAKAEVFMARV
jgi:hypothetical protein